MPRQIRCRCGQQIQIRNSEWLYVAAGLAIVGLLVNIVVIIYLYTRLNEVESHLALSAPQPRQMPTASGPGPGDPERARAAPPPATTPSTSPGVPRARTGKDSPPVSTDSPVAKPSGTLPGKPGAPAEGGKPAEESAEQTAIARAPGNRQLEEKPLGKSLEEAELWKEFFRAIEDRFRPPASEAGEAASFEKKPGGIAPRSVVEAPALARLLFLSRGSTLPVLTAAHLLDPDPRVHAHAIHLLLSRPQPGATESNTIRTLLGASAEKLLDNRRGRELLDRFQLDEKKALLPETKTEFDESWSTAITLAEGSRPGWPDLDSLEELLAGLERDGLDLVLAVDTTRSMEAGLGDLKKACSWLLPAMQWGAEGVRIGLLTYKDKVSETHPLSESPAEDLLPRILELKAVGGGDVPEGIDSALRAALELGRFAWRPSAAKRIVVIGDAPAYYSDLPAIESLVSACHEQAGFIVHMIGIHPKEGERVPFFERIAARGGGRSPTCPPAELGQELLLGALRAEDTTLPEDLVGLLRTVFSAIP